MKNVIWNANNRPAFAMQHSVALVGLSGLSSLSGSVGLGRHSQEVATSIAQNLYTQAEQNRPYIFQQNNIASIGLYISAKQHRPYRPIYSSRTACIVYSYTHPGSGDLWEWRTVTVQSVSWLSLALKTPN